MCDADRISRACGNTVSDEYVREAEARFAQRKVASTNRTEIHNINVRGSLNVF